MADGQSLNCAHDILFVLHSAEAPMSPSGLLQRLKERHNPESIRASVAALLLEQRAKIVLVRGRECISPAGPFVIHQPPEVRKLFHHTHPQRAKKNPAGGTAAKILELSSREPVNRNYLAEQLGISYTTCHEAVKRLVSLGMMRVVELRKTHRDKRAEAFYTSNMGGTQ